MLKKLALRVLKLRRYRVVAQIRDEDGSYGDEFLNLPGFLYLTEFGQAHVDVLVSRGGRYYFVSSEGGRLDLVTDCWIEPDPENGR